MAKIENPGKLAIVIIGAIVVLGAAALFLLPGERYRADPGNAAAVAVGEKLYGEYCASCHGTNLEGQANWRVAKDDGSLPAPPHDKTGHTWHHGDDLLFTYTKDGGAAIAPEGFNSAMPGFGDVLEDSEIWDVLAFIKSRWPEDIQQAQTARSQ